jgi:hypothetical protein
MPKKRATVTPIKNPTLFEMGKLEEAGRLANALKVERPYSEPGLFLGTSAFTAAGWPGTTCTGTHLSGNGVNQELGMRGRLD